MAKKDKAGKKGFGVKFNKNHNRLGVYEPLPKDTYRVSIKKAETAPTKAKDGKTLAVSYEVLKGEHKGKVFSKWYTYEHPNSTTVDIAHQHIASLCDAIGIDFGDLKDPSELEGKKLDIDVIINPGDNNYGPSNDIRIYSEIGKDKEEKADKGKKKDKAGKKVWDDDTTDTDKKDKKDKKKKDKKDKKKS